MTTSSAILLILMTTLAASYGWGMRGAVIGGEKGAMLPGALTGMCLALFSGIPAAREHWYIFAAASALGIGFGGFEPYAQTSFFMLKMQEPYYKPSVAHKGLMIKGANWFGIFGAITGIAWTAATGALYRPFEIVLLLLLQPFVQLLGVRIFNKPFCAKDGVFPKWYFSHTSREEWGGNLLFLVMLLLFTAIKGDFFAFGFCVVGIVCGAFGWVFSMWLCKITENPRKNGKYLFGAAGEKGYIDGWKAMELTYGAILGLSSSLYFVLTFRHTDNAFSQMLLKSTADAGRLFFGVRPAILEGAPVWVTLALTLCVPLLWKIAKTAVEKKGEKGERTARVCELAERAILYVLALCLVLLGSIKMSKLILGPILCWVLLEENVFEKRLRVMRRAGVWYAVNFVFFAAILAGEIFLANGLPMLVYLLLDTVLYIASDVLFFRNLDSVRKKSAAAHTLKGKLLASGSAFSVHLTFCVQSVILIAVFALNGFLK